MERKTAIAFPMSCSRFRFFPNLACVLVAFALLNPSAEADNTGTGFFVSPDGYVVTNYHVIEGGVQHFVKQGDVVRAAKLVVTDKVNDLALLKVAPEAEPFPYLAVYGASLPAPGEDVFTIGFPDPGTLGVTPKTTKGSITSLAGIKDDPRHLQMSVQIQPGNSGGPLLNEAGQVIGVTTSVINSMKVMDEKGYVPQNVNYSVKAAHVLRLFEKVPGQGLGAKLSGLRKQHFREIQEEAESAVMMVLNITARDPDGAGKKAPPAELIPPSELFKK